MGVFWSLERLCGLELWGGAWNVFAGSGLGGGGGRARAWTVESLDFGALAAVEKGFGENGSAGWTSVMSGLETFAEGDSMCCGDDGAR